MNEALLTLVCLFYRRARPTDFAFLKVIGKGSFGKVWPRPHASPRCHAAPWGVDLSHLAFKRWTVSVYHFHNIGKYSNRPKVFWRFTLVSLLWELFKQCHFSLLWAFCCVETALLQCVGSGSGVASLYCFQTSVDAVVASCITMCFLSVSPSGDKGAAGQTEEWREILRHQGPAETGYTQPERGNLLAPASLYYT